MNTEKKSKVDISIINNPDFINLSFSKFFSSFFQTQYSQLFKVHEQYNPLPLWKKFKQDYNHNNLLENCKTLVQLIRNTIIYAFLPGWFLVGFFETMFSSIVWEFTITKIQILINNHRISIRTSVITRPLNFTTVLSLFPFIIGFAHFFNRKYPTQSNQYFFQKNLPGLIVPTEKINWDTVQYFLKPNLKKENFDTKKIQSFYQDNSFILNQNIFEENIGQKIFINSYKKSPEKVFFEHSINNKHTLTLTSDFLDKKANKLLFQNLDELPAYLESFYTPEKSSSKAKPGMLINFKNFSLAKLPQYNVLNIQKFKKISKNNSLKKLSQTLFEFQNEDELFTNFKKKNPHQGVLLPSTSTIFLALETQQDQQFVSNNVEKNLEKTFLNHKYLNVQREFHSLWNLFQVELKNSFIENNTLVDFLIDEKNIQFFQQMDPKLVKTFKELSLREEKSLLEDILSSLTEKEIITNPFATRRMSGYRYPDMNSTEIHRLFLQHNLTQFGFPFQSSNNFLQLKFPSMFIETNQYQFNLEPVPDFSISTKPIILRDIETDKILYEGPGILLDKNTAFDWKTELLNDKQEKTLRFWFHRYISPYTSFNNSLTHFIGIYESPKISSSLALNSNESHLDPKIKKTQDLYLSQEREQAALSNKENTFNSEKQNWLKILPGFKKQNYSNENLDPKERVKLEKVTNINKSIFPLETTLNVPFISSEEWQTQYKKISQKKSQLKDSKAQSIGFEFFPVPIIQSRIPKPTQKLTQIHSQISLDDFIDYNFAKPLNSFKDTLRFSALVGRKATLQSKGGLNSFSLNAENYFQSVLENESFRNSLDSGFYKKIPSIFSSNKASINAFQNNWEPLSFQSWLIISQLSFAFFVFQILKNLYSLYGTELLGYFLDLVATTGVLDDQSKQQIELLMGTREKGFRIILKSRKKFIDIAGIQTLLPEVSEIVWFLRNSARNFSTSTTLPRGILLVGPPGTGKTILVQAIAGEANVPVVALSGSSLVEPGESSALKLELVFEEARRLAPCIVFMDEIDTLGQKREQVMQNPMANDDLLEVITQPTSFTTIGPEFGSFLKAGSVLAQSNNLTEYQQDPFSLSNTSSTLESQVNQQVQAHQHLEGQKINLLVQLLVELDGIKGREGVIVIGATNRPEMLDPALLRPGRFDRVLQLGLPGYHKRIEILKFYGDKLGYDQSISWNYFAERTAGFSSADLSSIMNVSSLKAIINNTYHTLESIEHGIDRIMTSEIQKESKQRNSIFENIRLAYYQAGKIVCTTLLEHHPPIVVAQLWTRRPNLRSIKIAQNLENYFFRFAHRNKVEHRIIGSYSGKAGEIFFLQKLFSSKSKRLFNEFFNINLSTLGLEDLSFAQVLIKFLIEKWYFSSNRGLLHRSTELSENRNFQELSQEKILLFDQLCQNLESSPRPIGQFLPGPFDESSKDEVTENENNNLFTQHTFSVPWWQYQISSELQVVERNFDFPRWYRIYLSNPQETELNPEWLPPDEFYHRNRIRKSVSLDSAWNDLGAISQDYQIQSLVIQSFNKAFVLLDQHRELLDILAFNLLNKKILRQWDINSLFQQYNVEFPSAKVNLNNFQKNEDDTSIQTVTLDIDSNLINQKVIVYSGWGRFSRRKISNWIDFKSLVKD